MRTKAMPPLVCSAVWLPTRRRLPPERIRSAVPPVLDDHLLQEARGGQLLQQRLQRRRLRGGLLAVGPLRVRIGTMTTTILDPVLGAPARELLFLIRGRQREEYLWDGQPMKLRSECRLSRRDAVSRVPWWFFLAPRGELWLFPRPPDRAPGDGARLTNSREPRRPVARAARGDRGRGLRGVGRGQEPGRGPPL